MISASQRRRVRQTLRDLLCTALIAGQVGCTQTYSIRCQSEPSGATVSVHGRAKGVTPCEVHVVPRREDLRARHLELTFTLPDGRSKAGSIDVRRVQPVAAFFQNVGRVIAAAGVIMILPWGIIHLSDDSNSTDEPETTSGDNDEGINNLALVGLGTALAGGVIYCLSGGEGDHGEAEIRVTFPEPAQDTNDRR